MLYMYYCKICNQKTYIIYLYYKGWYCMVCYTEIKPKLYTISDYKYIL